jgi:hypothetical protein
MTPCPDLSRWQVGPAFLLRREGGAVASATQHSSCLHNRSGALRDHLEAPGESARTESPAAAEMPA